MGQKMQALFTTGEFARLCGTTKETLFHYDEMGLLKPRKVGENGYRYYSSDQFFDFDLITVLREAGSSLREIRSYLEHREPEAFVALLRENERKLAQEKQKIEKMRRTVKNAIATAEYGLHGECGVPWLEDCPEEYFIATAARGDVLEMPDVVRSIQDHLGYCEAHGFDEDLAVGSIVRKESLLTGDYRESYYSTRVAKPVRSSRLYVKPAGNYACILHKGYYSGLTETYPQLLRFIADNGLQVCGDSFETDLLGYLSAASEEEFVLKLAIAVCPGEAG